MTGECFVRLADDMDDGSTKDSLSECSEQLSYYDLLACVEKLLQEVQALKAEKASLCKNLSDTQITREKLTQCVVEQSESVKNVDALKKEIDRLRNALDHLHDKDTREDWWTADRRRRRLMAVVVVVGLGILMGVVVFVSTFIVANMTDFSDFVSRCDDYNNDNKNNTEHVIQEILHSEPSAVLRFVWSLVDFMKRDDVDVYSCDDR